MVAPNPPLSRFFLTPKTKNRKEPDCRPRRELKQSSTPHTTLDISVTRLPIVILPPMRVCVCRAMCMFCYMLHNSINILSYGKPAEERHTPCARQKSVKSRGFGQSMKWYVTVSFHPSQHHTITHTHTHSPKPHTCASIMEPESTRDWRRRDVGHVELLDHGHTCTGGERPCG